MTLVKRNSFLPTFPHLFDDFFTKDFYNWGFNNNSSTNSTLPTVNIIEDNDGFTVEMASPGMQKEDSLIELDKAKLTISSEKKMDSDLREDQRYTCREFSYQSFRRTFHLPQMVVDESGISATYENGILRILIPKKEEAKALPPRQIDIL